MKLSLPLTEIIGVADVMQALGGSASPEGIKTTKMHSLPEAITEDAGF